MSQTVKNEALAVVLKRSFGFEPEQNRHHFRVFIPRSEREVTISEHLTWNEREGSSPVRMAEGVDGQVRVILPPAKWNAIAEAVRAEFNRRLRAQGKPPGLWRTGENWVRLDLGKELVLLAWAIEDADPGLIKNALANWLGLYPEERWWLFTQTAAATGHAVQGRGVGWRKAVRYALTENPLDAGSSLPEFYRRAETAGELPFHSLRETPANAAEDVEPTAEEE